MDSSAKNPAAVEDYVTWYEIPLDLLKNTVYHKYHRKTYALSSHGKMCPEAERSTRIFPLTMTPKKRRHTLAFKMHPDGIVIDALPMTHRALLGLLWSSR